MRAYLARALASHCSLSAAVARKGSNSSCRRLMIPLCSHEITRLWIWSQVARRFDASTHGVSCACFCSPIHSKVRLLSDCSALLAVHLVDFLTERKQLLVVHVLSAQMHPILRLATVDARSAWMSQASANQKRCMPFPLMSPNTDNRQEIYTI